ncbi:DUF4276 family protein [Allochromatium tepidum]|uniref:DUF4276 family protein n=1 Tax=Allochromatium tepidum TaxID=553982 RepID=UPI001BD073B9|nr:DUF4276 family protein [Allochromatium tepidum]
MRICVVCEGQTEVEFVKTTLAPYFSSHGIWVHPSILRAPSGRHRGGRVSIERLVNFIAHEYHDAERLTTLVDFYGFEDRSGRNPEELETAIRQALVEKIGEDAQRLVLPYLQVHEFEALLFSDPSAFEWVLDEWNEKAYQRLLAVRQGFNTPEEINDRPETAPSKRIEQILRSYSKPEHGPIIAEAIGIERMRQECPRFNRWIEDLRAWGNDGKDRP